MIPAKTALGTFWLRVALMAVALLAGFLYAPLRTSAHVAPTKRFTGVLQSVDQRNRTLTFQPGIDGSPLSLGWNWQTEFLAEDKRVKPDSLKGGMHVRVKYVSPLFGREYATKLEWNAPANPPPPSQTVAGADLTHH